MAHSTCLESMRAQALASSNLASSAGTYRLVLVNIRTVLRQNESPLSASFVF